MSTALGTQELPVESFSAPSLRDSSVSAWARNTDADLTAQWIEIEGWALGRDARVRGVEFLQLLEPLGEIPVDRPRPDVAAAFPGVADAATCGFHASVGPLTLTREFEIAVAAVLEDNTRVDLGKVTGGRPPLCSRLEPGIQPLMITTLGRSGSTVLVRLLNAHPEIASLEDDAKVANHWVQTLRELADPPRYLRRLLPSSQPGPDAVGWWIGTRAPIPRGPRDIEVQERLYATGSKDLATFVHERIDAVYRSSAAAAGQPDAAYYVEKYHPSVVPALMWELYPEGREVILVRDFRDFFCSVIAFNDRVGVSGFGAELQPDEAAHLQWLGHAAGRLAASWERRSGSAHLLRYEDLILQPADTIRALLEYLGLTADDQVVERMTARLFETAAGGEAHRTSPNARESIGRWERDLPPELQEVTSDAFSTSLSAFGYG